MCLPPLRPDVVAITDKVYLRNHGRIVAQLERSMPKSAFAGATLESFSNAERLDALDDRTRDRIQAFVTDFLARCDCRANPHCGHPQEAFVRYLLDLRADGLGPDGMVDAMRTDYGLEAYPGDILSFLDDAVRTLEAIEQLAAVSGEDTAARRARERRRALTG